MAGGETVAGGGGRQNQDGPLASTRPPRAADGGGRQNQYDSRPPDDAPPVVYIFDLDECLLMMESLRCGAYAAATAAEPDAAAAIALVGAKLTAAVLEAADDRLGYGRLEAADPASPCPVTVAEGAALPGPAGDAYAAAAALAASGAVLTPDQAARAAGLRAAADGLTGGWLGAAGRLLQGLNAAGGAGRGMAAPSRPVHAVCVTAGHPLPTLAKLEVFGLAPFFQGPGGSAILSSRGLPDGKAGAFRRLANEAGFRGRASFCVIGDGPEEEGAAGERGWPFVRVGPTAVGGEFGGEAVGGGRRYRPDALGRQTTPLPRLTVLDLRRAAGLL